MRLSFASFLWSPTRLKRKKRSHANFGLRSFYCYSEHYFCTFVILLIRLLGCLSKAQFINQMPNLDYLGRPYNDP